MALGQVRQGLDSLQSEEPLALDYLQRLNLAGLDTKGQLSLAFGQAGVNVAVSAGVDFGALLVPFVHLELGASLGGGGTADALLMIQRMPSRLWGTDIVQPQQAPPAERDAPLPPTFPPSTWSSRAPLAMAFMRGKTYSFKAAASAKAWAGIGTFDDQDETGATLGAKIEGDAGATLTRLIDPAATHYPPEPAGKALRDAVDDLFDANLKAKASAWLLGTAGGVKELQEFGAPDRTRATQVQVAQSRLAAATQRLKSTGVKVAKGAALLAKSYDELAIPDVDAFAASGVAETTLRALRAAGRRVRDALRSKSLKTDDLLAELDGVQKTLGPWVRWLSGPEARAKHDPRTCARLADLARRRQTEAKRLADALRRRSSRKTTPVVAPPVAPKPVPAFSLDIATREANGGITASAKLVLPRDKLKLQIAAGTDAKVRRNVFRYQSWVPGPPGRLLRCTQDTFVTYVSRRVFAEGNAQSRSFSKERSNLVTMSYRSALAQWFDNALAEGGKALPNGSGVSFGMSVLSDSLGAYVRCCKYLKDDPKHPEATLDDGLQALEAALTKQLRVQTEELRRFMRNAPSGLAAAVVDAQEGTRIESYLVEAAFAVTQPVALVFDPARKGSRVPDDLFELPDVAALIASGTRGTALRLQAIRLRYRIQTGNDKTVGMLSLGWNPEPWGEDSGDEVGDDAESWFEKLTGFDPSLPDWLKVSALAIEVGVEINAVRRVGCEGVVDLYTHYVPNPYGHEPPPAGYGRELALQHESSRRGELPEMLVPPVALFRQ